MYSYQALEALWAVTDLIKTRRWIFSDPWEDTRTLPKGEGPNGPALDELIEIADRSRFLHDATAIVQQYAAWGQRWHTWHRGFRTHPAQQAPHLAIDSAMRLVEAYAAYSRCRLGDAGDYSYAARLGDEARRLSDQALALYNAAWGSRAERAEREAWDGPVLPERSYPEVAEVGARIKRAREAAHLTQMQLAERIADRQPNIAAMEKGQRSIGSDVLTKLAPVLGVTLDWLVYGVANGREYAPGHARIRDDARAEVEAAIQAQPRKRKNK